MGGSGRGEEEDEVDSDPEEEEDEEEAPEGEANTDLLADPNWPEKAKEFKAVKAGITKERIFFDRPPSSYECLKMTKNQNNNFRNDFICSIKNNHPLLSLCTAEPDHPYGKKERTLVFITMLTTFWCIGSIPHEDDGARMATSMLLAPFLAIAETMMKHLSQCGPCQNPDSCWFKCRGCCEKLGCLGLACMLPTLFLGTLIGGIALNSSEGASVGGSITAFIVSRFSGWVYAIFPIGMFNFNRAKKKEKKKFIKNTNKYLEFMKTYEEGNKKSMKKKVKLEKKGMWDSANDIPVNHFVRRKGSTNLAVPPSMLQGGSRV